MMKSLLVNTLVLGLSTAAMAAESMVVCGGRPLSVTSKEGEAQVWEKVDLDLNLAEGSLSYDSYIGVYGKPETNSYRALTFVERFKLNNSRTRDSGTFHNLQELDVKEVTHAISSSINPNDVEKLYMGENWSYQVAFLAKLKDGNAIFSTGIVYSSQGDHCQQFKK